MVSYADFVTLLFAFFVVMYAISSVNEGKYRVLSETLSDAFVVAERAADPIQVGERVRSIAPQIGKPGAISVDGDKPIQAMAQVAQEGVPSTGPYKPPLSAIATRLQETLSDFAKKQLVNITRTDRGLEVEMKSKMLFASGSARLSREAVVALRDVAIILRPLENEIKVEGHTDNVPIATVLFPSNWELSAARAASVVHLFSRMGIDPKRMSAIGYGEHQPISSNDTEEGRQNNRRVAIVILDSKREREVRGLTSDPQASH